jgi:hypothetical protein
MEAIEQDARRALPPRPAPKTRCQGCGFHVTWAEQRKQYGRLVRRGLPPERIKAILPRCQKCVTRAMRG